MSQIGLNNMNIIFPFIILYYSNLLRLQFELSKNTILMKQFNNIYVTYWEIYQISICSTSYSIRTVQKVWRVEEEVFFILPSGRELALGIHVFLPSVLISTRQNNNKKFSNPIHTFFSATILYKTQHIRIWYIFCYVYYI